MVLGANRGLTRGFARIVAAPFVLLRIPPNAITVLALLLTAIPAWFAATAQWLWAGISLFLVSGFDLIDGTVARALNRETKFGGYLDSVLDRASDIIVLFAIGIGIDTHTGWLLIGACVLTSYLTSYTRARSYQDAQPSPATWNQFFERPERILFLTLALIAHDLTIRLRPEADVLPWLLLIYALLGLWTVLSRIRRVRAILEQTRK
jgi:archaetidylinositol phosphate synthase